MLRSNCIRAPNDSFFWSKVNVAAIGESFDHTFGDRCTRAAGGADSMLGEATSAEESLLRCLGGGQRSAGRVSGASPQPWHHMQLSASSSGTLNCQILQPAPDVQPAYEAMCWPMEAHSDGHRAAKSLFQGVISDFGCRCQASNSSCDLVRPLQAGTSTLHLLPCECHRPRGRAA